MNLRFNVRFYNHAANTIAVTVNAVRVAQPEGPERGRLAADLAPGIFAGGACGAGVGDGAVGAVVVGAVVIGAIVVGGIVDGGVVVGAIVIIGGGVVVVGLDIGAIDIGLIDGAADDIEGDVLGFGNTDDGAALGLDEGINDES